MTLFLYDYRLSLFFLSVKSHHISIFAQTRLYYIYWLFNFSFIKTLSATSFFFLRVRVKLIFGSSFSMNLSDSVHLCMCKKHFRVYCGLLSDLCQPTAVSTSLNFSVSTFAAKCFHFSPPGLQWHKIPFTLKGMCMALGCSLFPSFKWKLIQFIPINQCLDILN